MTMLQRSPTSQPASLVFTKTEIHLLEVFVKEKAARKSAATDLSAYIIKLACLGGYLNRAGDRPPGNKVIWRGLAKLNDIQLGFDLAPKSCG